MLINCISESEIRRELKKLLDKARYRHTLGVQKTAIGLAEIHKLPIKKTSLAALLHDCGKLSSKRKMASLIKKYKIKLDPIEQVNPSLWHAKIGERMAKRKFRINDFLILKAIKNHVTATPYMSKLEMVVYISDFIELGRGNSAIFKKIRKISTHSLKDVFREVLRAKITHVLLKKRALHPNSVKAWNWIVQSHLRPEGELIYFETSG